MKRSSYSLLFGVLSILLTVPGLAASVREAGGEASAAKAQNLLRQVADERDALSTENQKLNAKIASMESELKKLKNQLSKASDSLNGKDKTLSDTQVTLARYRDNNEKLRELLLKNRDRTRELVNQFRETISALRFTEAKNTELNVSLKEQQKQMLSCAQNNVKFYETNMELLEEYQNKGVWDAITQREPVTGIKNVEIENLVEKYRKQLDDFRVASTPTESKLQ